MIPRFALPFPVRDTKERGTVRSVPVTTAKAQRHARVFFPSIRSIRFPPLLLPILFLLITISLAPAILPETATAVPAARLDARYVGMEEDRVGKGGQVAPDGEEDALFRAVLDTEGERRVVKEILLQSSDRYGRPTGRQAWDTRPGGFWILGVYRDGERLNPTDREISDQVRRRVVYDLYANPGSFRPGDYFLVTVRFDDGGAATAVARVNVPPARLSASYLGMSRDVVGEGDRASPDGRVDGEFEAVLETGGAPRRVREIVLQSADARGLPAGPERWDTRPGGFWILGVSREGERLNPTDRTIPHAAANGTRYNLFASRPGGFMPGQHYRIVFRFAEGDEASSHVEISGESPPSAGQPDGPGPTPGGSGKISGSPWRPTTVPFDPECKTGCQEVMHVRDAHGADMTFMYNPKVDDAVAQWGDCVHSMLTCLNDGKTDLLECVGKSACPEPCRRRFLDRVGGERDPLRVLGVFEAVFIVKGAECGPGDGPGGK